MPSLDITLFAEGSGAGPRPQRGCGRGANREKPATNSAGAEPPHKIIQSKTTKFALDSILTFAVYSGKFRLFVTAQIL